MPAVLRRASGRDGGLRQTVRSAASVASRWRNRAVAAACAVTCRCCRRWDVRRLGGEAHVGSAAEARGVPEGGEAVAPVVWPVHGRRRRRPQRGGEGRLHLVNSTVRRGASFAAPAWVGSDNARHRRAAGAPDGRGCGRGLVSVCRRRLALWSTGHRPKGGISARRGSGQPAIDGRPPAAAAPWSAPGVRHGPACADRGGAGRPTGRVGLVRGATKRHHEAAMAGRSILARGGAHRARGSPHRSSPTGWQAGRTLRRVQAARSTRQRRGRAG